MVFSLFLFKKFMVRTFPRSCTAVVCTVRSSCCRSWTEGFFLFFKFWTRCLAIKIVLKVLKDALYFVNLWENELVFYWTSTTDRLLPTWYRGNAIALHPKIWGSIPGQTFFSIMFETEKLNCRDVLLSACFFDMLIFLSMKCYNDFNFFLYLTVVLNCVVLLTWFLIVFKKNLVGEWTKRRIIYKSWCFFLLLFQ